MIPDLRYQHMDNLHNNTTYIFSVVTYVGTIDRHTLYPWPCKIPFSGYGDHTVSRNYYMFRKYG